jgi:two-component system nitrogen regulation response regulator GlnG
MIQERKISKLGGKHASPVDVRIIVSSNIPLVKLVEEGKFRSDLYYRFNEFKIELPPLRKRKDDIPFLAKKFIDEGNMELSKNVKGLHKDSLAMLINYHWSGNVREFKNVIKRAVLLAEDLIEPSHLIFDNVTLHLPVIPEIIPEEKTKEGVSLREITKRAVHLVEKREIERALFKSSGNKSKASLMLKIDYKTLLTKINEYQIKYGTDSMENAP